MGSLWDKAKGAVGWGWNQYKKVPGGGVLDEIFGEGTPAERDKRKREEDLNAFVEKLGGTSIGDPVHQGQSSLARMLMDQARGNGPAQELIKRNVQQEVDRGIGLQRGQAAGAGSANQAMAGRNLAIQSAGISQQGAGARANAGLQAQLGSQQQLAGVYGQQASQQLQDVLRRLELEREARFPNRKPEESEKSEIDKAIGWGSKFIGS